MKRSRAVWLGFAALLLSVVLLVLWLPARWALPLVQARLHGWQLRAVQGSVWDGAADDLLTADGHRLGRVQWRLSRRALWGELALDLRFDGPNLQASGRLQRDAQGRQVWNEVQARVDLSGESPLLISALGDPQGTLEVHLTHAVLQANWPLQLDGRMQWHDAAMRTAQGRVPLGELALDLRGRDGVLQGTLHDLDHGPLQLDGQLQASPLGWRFTAALRARGSDPALRRWLGVLGHADSDGWVHLNRSGGLLVAAPSQGTTP